MEGGGKYNAASTAQAAAGDVALPQWSRAAGTIPAGAAAVVIADYGASQGVNSLRPLSLAIDTIRDGAPDREILVVHTDLPSNDFGTLLTTVDSDPGSYRRDGVYTTVVGRSFYEQLLPDSSVWLGWSSIALHWLSRVPGPLDGFWYASGSAEQRAVWQSSAAADWQQFLTARHRELRPGGRLVVVVGAARPDGTSGAEPAMALVQDGVDGMVDDGLLSPAERTQMAVPAWYRTEPEWRAPFGDGRLALEELRFASLGDPLWTDASESRSGPRHEIYARAVAAALRASFGPSLLGGIPSASQDDIATELFDRRVYESVRVANRPLFDWYLAVLTIASPSG